MKLVMKIPWNSLASCSVESGQVPPLLPSAMAFCSLWTFRLVMRARRPVYRGDIPAAQDRAIRRAGAIAA